MGNFLQNKTRYNVEWVREGDLSGRTWGNEWEYGQNILNEILRELIKNF